MAYIRHRFAAFTNLSAGSMAIAFYNALSTCGKPNCGVLRIAISQNGRSGDDIGREYLRTNSPRLLTNPDSVAKSQAATLAMGFKNDFVETVMQVTTLRAGGLAFTGT